MFLYKLARKQNTYIYYIILHIKWNIEKEIV